MKKGTDRLIITIYMQRYTDRHSRLHVQIDTADIFICMMKPIIHIQIDTVERAMGWLRLVGFFKL